jgi:hypothetical protein
VSGVVAIIAFAVMGTALASCSGEETAASTTPTSSSSTQSQEPTAPFQTSDGFAWLTAACGSPSVVDASPNSWLPKASNVVLCMTPPGQPAVLVGVYDNPSASAEDLAKAQGQHGYATRQDGEGRTWIFVVEGTDPSPLRPLERYGFVFA